MAGQPRPRCTATTSKGAPCLCKAIPGGAVCRYHGGSTTHIAAKAEQRAALAKAERLAARVGIVLDPEDPYEGAAAAMRQARSIAQRLGQAVDGLDDDELRYQHEKAGEQVRAEVPAYQKAVSDLGQLSIAVIRAGLDEQLVELAQARSVVITAVVLAVLDALALDDDRRQIALAAADAELEHQAAMLGA